ncbi:hypothetical protein RHSIM_Rhsim01G0035300 [Rhododendron simsii]|uniref:protein-serine/threonine phosphatase n=1 Tax=Rhododendron simsii TaxID=118357 RepID=A0A834HJK3_RHOSS|nr:hypothetical protein RHSIM_Rhsim01G0035300 [Rhododendron simsii]
MEVGRRRGTTKNGVVEGSVWESRMKSDEVKGGIKVCNAEEKKPEENGEKRMRPKQSPTGANGKRKTWKSESSDGIERSPIQISKQRSEPRKELDQQCKELSVSSDGTKIKSPVPKIKKTRSEVGKEVSVSVDGIERNPNRIRKSKSESLKLVCQSEGEFGNGDEIQRDSTEKMKTRSGEIKEARVSVDGTERNPVQARKLKSESLKLIGQTDVESGDGDGIERNLNQLRRVKSESNRSSGESFDANEMNSIPLAKAKLDPGEDLDDGNGRNSIESKAAKSEPDKGVDESVEEIEKSPVGNEKIGCDESCKEFGVCEEKEVSCGLGMGQVKSAPDVVVDEEDDDYDDDGDEEEDDDDDDGDKDYGDDEFDEEIEIDEEKKRFEVKEIDIVEEEKPKQIVNEQKKMQKVQEKPSPISPIVKKQVPPVVNHSRVHPIPTKTKASPVSNAFQRPPETNTGFQRVPQTHNKLQSLVDLVMWRDVSKSAFIFGLGTFIIISLSYTKDINISFITVISYLGLAYLAVIFLFRSIICRGVTDVDYTSQEYYVVGEGEAMWLVKMVLPYLNEFLVKLRALFSGDPATTMKCEINQKSPKYDNGSWQFCCLFWQGVGVPSLFGRWPNWAFLEYSPYQKSALPIPPSYPIMVISGCEGSKMLGNRALTRKQWLLASLPLFGISPQSWLESGQMSLAAAESPQHSSSSDDFAAFLDGELDYTSDTLPDEEDEDEGDTGRVKRRKVEVQEGVEDPEGCSTSQLDIEQSLEASIEEDVCKHPGFISGLCYMCGLKVDVEKYDSVALTYVHQGMRVVTDEIARVGKNEWKKLLLQKKLYLVLDLDHTLLNSTRLVDLTPDEEYLKSQIDSLQDFARTGAGDFSDLGLVVESPECDSNSFTPSGFPLNPPNPLKTSTGFRFFHQYGQKSQFHAYENSVNRVFLPGCSGEMLEIGKEMELAKDISRGSLFRLDFMNMLTKLRPFVRTFLEEANNMFEMYIYTMGERSYALQMASLLDPEKVYFRSGVIAKDDSTQKHQKGLDVVLGQESAVLILDDTESVWAKHKENLILMERYHFFASSCRQFGFNCKSLSELKSDETETEGALASVLKVLKQIHSMFFDTDPGADLADRDVRQVLKTVRRSVLNGCTVVFSRVFPTRFQAENHHLWKMAEQLGAICLTEVDPSVTHVVSTDTGTEKSRWALQEKKFLVHPQWIEATNYFWQKQPEDKFPVSQPKSQ